MISPKDVEKYFETRLHDQKLTFNKKNVPARCPFHEDATASLSIHAESGKWRCHGCGKRGSIVDFECYISGLDRDASRLAVSKLLGIDMGKIPESIYDYTDARGRIIFQKLKYLLDNGKKRFICRMKGEDGRWVYDIENIPVKPLYCLHGLIAARYVFICEGEKDCDNLNDAIRKSQQKECIAVCNFDGAGNGKWKEEYSKYFAGKTVCILPDNDEVGASFAKQVAQSVYPWSSGVKIVTLPGLSEKGDVTDFLASHPVEELFKIVSQTAPYIEEIVRPRAFVQASDFMASHHSDNIDWLVEGIIQRGGCGMVVAEPGAGKSWLSFDLALGIATGTSFLGHKVAQRGRVAVMAREDHPALSGWRMRHLYLGKGTTADLDGYLWMNTSEQQSGFSLQNDVELDNLCRELEEFSPDFLIMDVLNVMHDSEENDNTAMRQVMKRIDYMHNRVKCGICLVHHESKSNLNRAGSLKKRARGASAIGGWAQWMMAIEISNPDDPQREWIRRVEFETKAFAPANPVEFMIDSDDYTARLKIVNGPDCIQYTQPEQQRFM